MCKDVHYSTICQREIVNNKSGKMNSRTYVRETFYLLIHLFTMFQKGLKVAHCNDILHNHENLCLKSMYTMGKY